MPTSENLPQRVTLTRNAMSTCTMGAGATLNIIRNADKVVMCTYSNYAAANDPPQSVEVPSSDNNANNKTNNTIVDTLNTNTAQLVRFIDLDLASGVDSVHTKYASNITSLIGALSTPLWRTLFFRLLCEDFKSVNCVRTCMYIDTRHSSCNTRMVTICKYINVSRKTDIGPGLVSIARAVDVATVSANGRHGTCEATNAWNDIRQACYYSVCTPGDDELRELNELVAASSSTMPAGTPRGQHYRHNHHHHATMTSAIMDAELTRRSIFNMSMVEG